MSRSAPRRTDVYLLRPTYRLRFTCSRTLTQIRSIDRQKKKPRIDRGAFLEIARDTRHLIATRPERTKGKGEVGRASWTARGGGRRRQPGGILVNSGAAEECALTRIRTDLREHPGRARGHPVHAAPNYLPEHPVTGGVRSTWGHTYSDTSTYYGVWGSRRRARLP
jgi:hypothetical protein